MLLTCKECNAYGCSCHTMELGCCYNCIIAEIITNVKHSIKHSPFSIEIGPVKHPDLIKEILNGEYISENVLNHQNQDYYYFETEVADDYNIWKEFSDIINENGDPD